MASLFVLINGHFGVLQAVAWGKMLWSNTHENGSLLVAAKQTFDGEHPCHMCDSIKEAKEKKHRSPVTLASEKKIELFPLETANLLPKRGWSSFQFPKALDVWHEARFVEPPVPVPIAVFLTA